MTIGTGSHRYEWDGNWAKLPDGVAFGYTHGVDVDKSGRIYIFNTSKDAVCVFDAEGNYLTSWGEQFAGGAHGMLLHEEDGTEYLYLTDTALQAVYKTTLDGREVLRFGLPDLPGVYTSPDLFKPTECCVAPNGDVYVTDGYGQNWIHRYDKAGNYLDSFGGPGSELGQLKCPHALRLYDYGDQPVLLVADRANIRLQCFDLGGKSLGVVTDELRHPCNVDFYNGDTLVPDLHSRLTLLDQQGKLIGHLGDNPDQRTKQGWPNLPDSEFEAGKFSSPHHACFDAAGNIYCVEWTVKGRVTKLHRAA